MKDIRVLGIRRVLNSPAYNESERGENKSGEYFPVYSPKKGTVVWLDLGFHLLNKQLKSLSMIHANISIHVPVIISHANKSLIFLYQEFFFSLYKNIEFRFKYT